MPEGALGFYCTALFGCDKNDSAGRDACDQSIVICQESRKGRRGNRPLAIYEKEITEGEEASEIEIGNFSTKYLRTVSQSSPKP